MTRILDFIRAYLMSHPNVANALALLVTAILAAIAADLGVGDPGADVVRTLAP